MNIFDLLEAARTYTRKAEEKKRNYSFNYNSTETNSGMSLTNQSVPWMQNTPNAQTSDFDNDGISDALDNFFGMGAYDHEES